MTVKSIFRALRIPLAGSPAGEQSRDRFYSDLFAIMGDVRLFHNYESGDTTTSTDRSRHAATITYSKDVTTFDTPPKRLGSGYYVDLDGVDEEADSPDAARLSFGDGTNDEPFTIIALVNPDDTTPTAQATIFGKWNLDTDGQLREYVCYLSATNGYPTMELYDESANASIGRADNTALTAGWRLLGFAYDATIVSAGVHVFVDAAELDDADVAGGSYIAMENTTAVAMVAHRLSAASTPVAEAFFAGGIAFIAVCQGALSAHEMWQIKERVNAYYDLEL